jgi:hypothetical protein
MRSKRLPRRWAEPVRHPVRRGGRQREVVTLGRRHARRCVLPEPAGTVAIGEGAVALDIRGIGAGGKTRPVVSRIGRPHGALPNLPELPIELLAQFRGPAVKTRAAGAVEDRFRERVVDAEPVVGEGAVDRREQGVALDQHDAATVAGASVARVDRRDGQIGDAVLLDCIELSYAFGHCLGLLSIAGLSLAHASIVSTENPVFSTELRHSLASFN